MKKRHLFIIAGMALLCMAGSGGARAQSQDQNYILTRTYLDESRERYLDDIQYFDGLGRSSEQVARRVTPTGRDLVSLREYDNAGRPSNSWLPGASTGDGAFVDAATIKAAAVSLNGDASPFSTPVYDNSPLDRVLEQYGPGSTWHSTGHSAKTAFMANDPNVDSLRCVVFHVTNNTRASADTLVSIMGTGYYEAGTLSVTRSADEDGRATLAFTDRQGRLVLSRQITGSGTTRTFYDTNYVYDNAGNLTAVLPPLASDAMIPSPAEEGWMCSNANTAALRQYAYLYCYDGRNRVRAKRLPGTDWTLYVHDSADRVILTQDGNGQAKGEWVFTIADNMGRPCLTGKCAGGYGAYSSLNNRVWCTRTNATDALKGYAITGISLNSPSVLRASYYDDYGFMGRNGFDPSKVGFLPLVGYAQPYANPRGKLTGATTAMVSENGLIGYQYSSVYYDDKARVIQTRKTHLLGGMDASYTAYNFAGQPTGRKHVHTSGLAPTQTEVYEYSYDNAMRLDTVKYSLNGAEQINLAVNTYDGLGRLTGEKIGGTATSNMSYAYNVRSWVGSVQSPLFREYVNRQGGSRVPAFNGNVSSMRWMVPTDGKGMRAYEFGYDGLNRLARADYSPSGTYTEAYDYDKMGNMLGVNPYVGNRIAGRGYDANGNIVKDLSNNILGIQYNVLNLPNYVNMVGDSIIHKFIYDMDGRKLYSNVSNTNNWTIRDEIHYCDNMIYKEGVLYRILLGGYGYYTVADQQYHWYQKDHLGNNRLVVNQDGTIEQVSHYYPYGNAFAEGLQNANNPYRYNGKELDHFTNWYDYSARYMDPTLGRFTTMDPMAEKYYSVSPYAYAGNNPVNNTDPTGKWIVGTDGKRVSYSVGDDGTLSWSNNASADVQRIGNALYGTPTGRSQLQKLNSSDIKVSLGISPESQIVHDNGMVSYTYGETVPGNFNKKDNYGKFVRKDGTYGIKEAKITIYEGTIADDAKTSNPKHAGLTMDQAIGAVAGHEIVHATDKVEINKDLKYEQKHNRESRPYSQKESKPNIIEKKIKDESLNRGGGL